MTDQAFGLAVRDRMRPTPPVQPLWLGGDFQVGGGLQMKRIAIGLVITVAATPAIAQEFYRSSSHQLHPSSPPEDCAVVPLPVPALERFWNVRAAVVWQPAETAVLMTFYDPDDPSRDIGSATGHGGYLEVETRLPAAPQRTLAVCVRRGSDDFMGVATTYTIRGSWVGTTDPLASSPTASDWTPYNDETHRHVIFNAYDAPTAFHTQQSLVLPAPDPQFYIRLGGPNGCDLAGSRMTIDVVHYWRAMVPILLEQLTGVPYRHRVRAGCEPLPDRPGWVMVHHATPEEYEAETGKEWGRSSVKAKARVGAAMGRIWIGIRPLNNRLGTVSLTSDYRPMVAHQIGHAMGLFHTRTKWQESTKVMDDSSIYRRAVLFSAEEEVSARRAYRAGRAAMYCGDPDICGRGAGASSRRAGLEWPPIVITN